MLDYTIVAWEKALNDAKRVFYGIGLVSQILYIAYLLYSIFAPAGIFIVNVILCVVSVIYFAFYVFYYDKCKDYIKNRMKHAFVWFKIGINAFTLGVALYGIYAATTNITPTSVIMVAMMVVSWVLRVFLELAVCFLEGEFNLVLEGLRADWDNATKPVKTVSNAIKKITGQEVEPEPEPSKMRKILDIKVMEKRAENKRVRVEKRKKAKEKKQTFTEKELDNEKTNV